MITSAHINWRMENAAVAVALLTTNTTGQLAAARVTRLAGPLAANAGLSDEAWWTLARKPRVSIEVAESLYSRTLDPEQLAHAAADTRCKASRALLSHGQPLPDDIVAVIESRVPRYSTLSADIAWSRGVSLETAMRHYELIDSYGRIKALARQSDRLTDAQIIAHLVDPAIAGRALRWGMLPEILEERPSLSAALLTAIADGKARSTRDNLLMLPALAECRHAAGDAWRTIAEILGPKNTWTSQRGIIWAAVAGNPNTDADGVAWALGHLARHNDRIASMKYVADRVHAMIQRRAQDLVPVTSDWHAPADPQQARTIDELAWYGIVTIPSWYRTHPRWELPAAENGQNASGTLGADFDPAAAPVRSPRVAAASWSKEAWEAEQDWRAGLAATLGNWIDAEMADADEHTWATFYSLSEGWDGTLGELVSACKTL